MLIREAQLVDIAPMSVVRLAVKENILSNPTLVTYDDYVDHLSRRGKGWVAEVANHLVGFVIVDLLGCNLWALFVDPAYEGQGIGRALHDTMLAWYFQQTTDSLGLGTGRGTRAAAFYRSAGWRDMGLKENGEVRFEMRYLEKQVLVS